MFQLVENFFYMSYSIRIELRVFHCEKNLVSQILHVPLKIWSLSRPGFCRRLIVTCYGSSLGKRDRSVMEANDIFKMNSQYISQKKGLDFQALLHIYLCFLTFFASLRCFFVRFLVDSIEVFNLILFGLSLNNLPDQKSEDISTISKTLVSNI